ncbi:CoA transferase [Streptomyces boninensis]|uniref:CoA transferase n=1 Tax=Streptomyces boninensis TaxID=2039455 RepID=UPI003B221611
MRGGADVSGAAWAALGGDAGLLEQVEYGGPAGLLAGRLPVMALARGSVAVCSLAAAEFAARRWGGGVPRVRVDDGAVATAFVSERHLRVDGRAPVNFAPLSRFWAADGGWVRTHANYPHHRARLLAALGVADGGAAGTGAGAADGVVERVARELAKRRPEEIEEAVFAAGGLAVAVREPAEWAVGEQGRLVGGRPLLSLERDGGAEDPRGSGVPSLRGLGVARLPAAGMRVLDLTRVISGPVATRTLALLGADVLRVDAPQLPESQDAHNDTGFGKRSVSLDLDRAADRRVFDELLGTADVVVTGYRPGALDRFGLDAAALAERRPGLVIVRLSTWGEYGPWGGRRGFDSLVQAATGIAALERAADGTPGVLPAQALDHGTGYLIAAAVLRALTERLDTGGTYTATFALAQTAHWLLTAERPDTAAQPDTAERPQAAKRSEAAGPVGAYDDAPTPYDATPHLKETPSSQGLIRHARPPITYDGSPTTWPAPPGPLGSDLPHWRQDAA